jgi:hypothetical protein
MTDEAAKKIADNLPSCGEMISLIWSPSGFFVGILAHRVERRVTDQNPPDDRFIVT